MDESMRQYRKYRKTTTLNQLSVLPRISWDIGDRNKKKENLYSPGSKWLLYTHGNSINNLRDFPGGPVVKTQGFIAGGPGSTPGQESKIPHAMQCGQK